MAHLCSNCEYLPVEWVGYSIEYAGGSSKKKRTYLCAICGPLWRKQYTATRRLDPIQEGEHSKAA